MHRALWSGPGATLTRWWSSTSPISTRLAASTPRHSAAHVCLQVWAWRSGGCGSSSVSSTARWSSSIRGGDSSRCGIPAEPVGHPLLDLTPKSRGPRRARPSGAWMARRRRWRFRAAVRTSCAPRRPRQAAVPPTRPVPGVQFIVARALNLPNEPFEPLRGVGGSRIAGIAGAPTMSWARPTWWSPRRNGDGADRDPRTPMVIVGRLSPLTYRLGKRFVKVDTFGMANLVRAAHCARTHPAGSRRRRRARDGVLEDGTMPRGAALAGCEPGWAMAGPAGAAGQVLASATDAGAAATEPAPVGAETRIMRVHSETTALWHTRTHRRRAGPAVPRRPAS
jgi:hypothetical protein